MHHLTNALTPGTEVLAEAWRVKTDLKRLIHDWPVASKAATTDSANVVVSRSIARTATLCVALH